MFTGNKFTVSVLSALTLAILTACGGSSEEFTLDRDHKWSHEPDRAKKEKRKHAELPAVNIPAPTSFLDDPKKTGNSTSDNNTDKKVSPKQAGNVVTVVDHDYDQGYKTIKFNQPGMIDYLCVGGRPDGVCASKKATNAENNKAEIAKKEKELTEAEKLVSDKEMELTSDYKKNIPGLSDDELKKLIDNSSGMKALRDKVKNVKDKIEELKGEQTKLEQNAKNEVFFFKPDGERVEKNNYRNSYSKEKDIEDAGIVPVAGFYDKNGDLRVQKGMVGREFDGIIVLENDKNKKSYLRDPVAAGWSYNTFGVFQEKRGNSDVRGYQSIGIKTQTSALERENADKDSEANKRYMEKYLPYYGRATYTGIGHAYHNDEQVTMNVKVDADFHDRHLNFETSNATAHTFEKEGHLTRVRPDLDLKGAADWAADVADFRGKVHNVGGNLEGQLEGSFYGDGAAEVGGVYGLHGKDKEGKPVNYVGGFGAKRP
ncbi:transferrin-binding protein-like solute binding protein [Dichelobacter nodosus]|uniref:transferrin-binding protein-like solute binding protein n=1 Tax=Dichelobacter nodosus TaxID=870 RepID=UPI0006801449|nr:transferrin-binding protein-like solute binding protein [Dichelobacter nodosus]